MTDDLGFVGRGLQQGGPPVLGQTVESSVGVEGRAGRQAFELVAALPRFPIQAEPGFMLVVTAAVEQSVDKDHGPSTGIQSRAPGLFGLKSPGARLQPVARSADVCRHVKDAALAINRRGHVHSVRTLQRHGPEQLAGVQVDAETVCRGAIGEDSASGIAKEDRRRIGGAIPGERLGCPEGTPVLLIQGGHERLLASRRYHQPGTIDQQTLGEAPGELRHLESLPQVAGPEFLPRGGVQTGDAAMTTDVVELARGVNTAGPGSRIGTRPGSAIFGPPHELAVQIEGIDDQVVVHVAGNVQPTADNDGR